MSPFMSLPRELRDHIYQYILVAPGSLDLIPKIDAVDCPSCCESTIPMWINPTHGLHRCFNCPPRVDIEPPPGRLPRPGFDHACTYCTTTTYRLALPCHQTEPLKRKDLWSPEVALLRTSRQIFDETLPILYGENTFAVVGGCELLDWNCFGSDSSHDFDLQLVLGEVTAEEIMKRFLLDRTGSVLTSIKSLRITSRINDYRHNLNGVYSYIGRSTLR